jgi:hypothetical protein
MDFGPEYSYKMTEEFYLGLSHLVDNVEKTDKDKALIKQMMTNLLHLISLDGLNPNAIDILGMPCLSYVFNYIQFRPFRKIARALMKRFDINPNTQDCSGVTPLMHLIIATKDFQDEIWLVPLAQEFFQCKNLNVNMQTSYGQSTLYMSLQAPCNYIIGHMILNNEHLIITRKDYDFAQQQQLKIAQNMLNAEKKEKKKSEKKKKKKKQIKKPQPTSSIFKPENYSKNAELYELVIKKYENAHPQLKKVSKKKKSTRRKKKSQEPKE